MTIATDAAPLEAPAAPPDGGEVPRKPRAGRVRRARGGQSASPPLRGLLPIVLILVVWQVIGDPDSFAFPPPSTWFEALRGLWSDGLIQESLGQTVRTFVVGLVLASIAGLVLGGCIGASKRIDQGCSLVVDFFRALPPPAVIPVIMLMIGPTYRSALLIVMIGAMWPIVLNTSAGMRAVPATRLEAARTLGLPRVERIRKVVLPSLIPSVLIGVRVSVSIAFVITLFIEILGVSEGIGQLMMFRQQRYDSAGTWGILLIIGLCGYAINVGVARIDRFMLRRWPPTKR